MAEATDAVPLVSAHSGLSGSKYDKKIPKPLTGKSVHFGAAIDFAVQRARRADSMGATTPPVPTAPTDPSATLTSIIEKRRAGAGLGASKDGTKATPLPVKDLSTWRLDEDHVTVLRTVFDFLDGDGDGFLNDEELRVAVTAVGVPPTWPLLRRIKAGAPPGQGVHFELFVASLEDKFRKEPLQVADVEKLFGHYEEPRGSGLVQAYQVRHVLAGVQTAYGTHLTDAEVDDIMRCLSVDEGEAVDYKQFLLALTSGFVQFDTRPPPPPKPSARGRSRPGGAGAGTGARF